jgi:hypothetical protein
LKNVSLLSGICQPFVRRVSAGLPLLTCSIGEKIKMRTNLKIAIIVVLAFLLVLAVWIYFERSIAGL